MGSIFAERSSRLIVVCCSTVYVMRIEHSPNDDHLSLHTAANRFLNGFDWFDWSVESVTLDRQCLARALNKRNMSEARRTHERTFSFFTIYVCMCSSVCMYNSVGRLLWLAMVTGRRAAALILPMLRSMMEKCFGSVRRYIHAFFNASCVRIRI